MALFGKYRVIEDAVKLEQDLKKLQQHKQTIKRDESMNTFIKDEQVRLMKRVSRRERRASECDTHDLPLSEVIVDWKHFNTDMYSSDRKYDELRSIAEQNPKERIDLRPYMVEGPIVCFTTDKF